MACGTQQRYQACLLSANHLNLTARPPSNQIAIPNQRNPAIQYATKAKHGCQIRYSRLGRKTPANTFQFGSIGLDSPPPQ
jgi:hypothetical protein